MLAFLGALALATTIAQGGTPSPGDAAFARGEFMTAFRDYNDGIIANPDDEDAILGLATLDLYRNDWANARTYLRRARQLDPGDPRVEERLATLARRLPKPGIYRFLMSGTQSESPFVTTEPVPVIHLNVNGRTLAFAVDTSARSIDLTPRAARTLNIADGALIAKVGLPNLVVTNVPSRIVMRAQLPGMQPVDGWLGTVFLTHFLPTFDYAHNRLILRKWESYETVEAQARQNHADVERLWLIGDDLLVAKARIDTPDARLYAIETGRPDRVSTDLSPFADLPFHVAGSLGNAYFHPSTLTLDFAAMKMLITR